MDYVLQTGLRGVQLGTESATKNAERVTKALLPDSKEDLVDALVGLAADKRQVEASAKVIKVGDELIGSILDILG